MASYNLAFIGFGNVGQNLAILLMKKREELKEKYNITFRVTAIATGQHGLAINHEEINLNQALKLVQAKQSIDILNTVPFLKTTNPIFDFIHNSGANVLFETVPVNYETGQPAVEYLTMTLQHGMHAISANKGPIVHGYHTLSALAKKAGVNYSFESAVMDGAPIFSLFRNSLPAANLLSFVGILNSTTNLILSRMEKGESFRQAVIYAQNIGIAETDPSGDIDGWDSAVKIAALITVLMDIPFSPIQVKREGIRAITDEDMCRARDKGKRWKLVCSAQRKGNMVEACVAPEMVSPSSPLYGVENTSSMIQLETDVLSGLTIIENNPTPETTAYGLLTDFINAVRA